MSFGSILVLALGLAMDATAVCAARGCGAVRIRSQHVLRVALFFGGFQALMPLVGWVVGRGVGPFVQSWDHWIVFVLLSAIGGKMVWEARSSDEDEAPRAAADLFGLRVLLLLALATSIDALAVGFTLPMLGAPLVLSLATIGITTAFTSVAGLFAGKRFGAALGSSPELVGGIVLIGLGTKILIEHLASGA
jgi:manganese efflux pump family protein